MCERIWLPDSPALSDWHNVYHQRHHDCCSLTVPVIWLLDSSALPDCCNETLTCRNGSRARLAVVVLFLTVLHVTAGAQARGVTR